MENNAQASNTIPPNTPIFQIPGYVLDDLCSRFIINIPEEERQDLIRIFFMIELAHWFYLDFYCAENPELKTCGIKDFSAQIFQHCPSLSGHAQEVDKILGNWKSYKMSVPTYGAIMLDPDMKYTLLVQGFWAKASWGFPKGKVNEGEESCQCAIREVHEETGFDVSSMIKKEEDFLENKMNEQVTRLYIIQNVPLDTKFQPKTRKEIKSLQWFPIDSLPAHKRDQTSKSQLGLNPNTFFMVIPFVKNLRKWIQNFQNPPGPKPSARPHSAADSYKSTKTHDDSNNSGKQYRDKQKLKQQQYFAQQNQSEFQEFLQFKDSKSRGREAREQRKQRSESPRKEAYQKGGYCSQGYSPSLKQEKKQQFQILNRDGSLLGTPRRSLASQFENQGSPGSGRGGKYSHRQRHTDQSSIDTFIPEAWANFKFDVGAIMACLPSL